MSQWTRAANCVTCTSRLSTGATVQYTTVHSAGGVQSKILVQQTISYVMMKPNNCVGFNV